MNKFYKILLSLTMVIASLLIVPVKAKNGGAMLSCAGWTGVAFDINSKEEHSNTGGDGPVSNLFDANSNSIFHTDYSKNVTYNKENRATLPVYIFIDLGSKQKIASFLWKNRTNNDAVKDYEFYVNTSKENLMPSSNQEGGYTEDLSNWILAASSKTNGVLLKNNTAYVDLNDKYNAKQIMIKVLSTYSSDAWGDVEGVQTLVTCADFKLFNQYQNSKPLDKRNDALDRSNWSVMSYNDKNQEYYELGHPEEGNPQYLIDGNTKTWWHTTYRNESTQDSGKNLDVPYYVVVDLSKDDAKAVDFKSFSWTNRGFQNENAGANGIVTKYKFYITNDDSVVKPYIEGTKTLNQSWIDVTDTIVGCEVENVENNETTIGRMRYGTINPDNIYTTYVNFNEIKSAQKVMIKILETKNSTGLRHGSGVEFNLYKDVFKETRKLDLTSSENLIGCSAGIKVNGDGAHDNASVLTDQKTDTKYVSVDAADSTDPQNPGTPVYFQIDMKRIYNIDKIVVDFVDADGRTYNNVVIVVSDTLEGFENAYDRTVLFNADTGNKTVFFEDRPFDHPQPSIITAHANDATTTGRYVRVYTNGNTINQGNHIYEIEVYGCEVEDNSTQPSTKNSLVEGYYTDDTFTEKAVNPGVTRYVHNSVLDVKKQVKLSDDGTYSIRFVSSVASLNAKKVGFKLQKNSGTPKEYTNGDVYTILNQNVNGVKQELYARDVFDNQVSNYFSTFKLNGIPANATGTLYVTPFWELDNGDKFYGATVEYDIATVIAEFNAN